jgi:hydroxymethylbilane synthase
MNRLRIATRGSLLALAQTKIVADRLAALGIASETLVVLTKGDRDTRSPLPAIGGDGLFVRGIEEALLSGQADIAVHSAKDLPYDLAEGLLIGGIPQAQDPRERLLTRREQLPPGPRIGTDSPRRREAFRRLCPDAVFCSLRGNVPTRVEKLRRGEYDGILLAQAGLLRLGLDLSGLHGRVLEIEEMLPAPCQGILAVECRERDTKTWELLGRITDPLAARRFAVERFLFCGMRAGCSAAVGAHAEIRGDWLGVYGCFEGKYARAEGSFADYRSLCDEVRNRIWH